MTMMDQKASRKYKLKAWTVLAAGIATAGVLLFARLRCVETPLCEPRQPCVQTTQLPEPTPDPKRPAKKAEPKPDPKRPAKKAEKNEVELCGNGKLDQGEDCDTGHECKNKNEKCDKCVCVETAPEQTCGNNVREGTEACDGTDKGSCTDSQVCRKDCSGCEDKPQKAERWFDDKFISSGFMDKIVKACVTPVLRKCEGALVDAGVESVNIDILISKDGAVSLQNIGGNPPENADEIERMFVAKGIRKKCPKAVTNPEGKAIIYTWRKAVGEK